MHENMNVINCCIEIKAPDVMMKYFSASTLLQLSCAPDKEMLHNQQFRAHPPKAQDDCRSE